MLSSGWLKLSYKHEVKRLTPFDYFDTHTHTHSLSLSQLSLALLCRFTVIIPFRSHNQKLFIKKKLREVANALYREVTALYTYIPAMFDDLRLAARCSGQLVPDAQIISYRSQST